MRSICLVFATILLDNAMCCAAEQSWTGKISDSVCGAKHKATDEHSVLKLSDSDCTAACVKSGAKYVLWSNGKAYRIDNQDFAGLQDHAGQTVRVMGKMRRGAIKISQISPHLKEHKGEKSSL